MREPAAELLVRVAAETLRPDALRAFEAAWDWTGPQARTEEERRLLAAVLLLLHGIQAVVIPRRLTPGALADLHVTATRVAASGPVRRHLFVAVTADGIPSVPDEPDRLCFSAAEVRAAPFRCAARIVGELLTRLAEE